MSRINQVRRSRLEVLELDRVAAENNKSRVGLPPLGWAGLGLLLLMLTMFLLVLIDGRQVVHAREKGRPWSVAVESGDWATVLLLAKAGVDKNPRDAVAQNAYGLALMETGKLDEAQNPLIAAESLSPEVPEYKVDLGNLYLRKGVTELAATRFRGAIELDPSLVDVRWKLARALYATQQYDATLSELNEITRLEPDNWDAYRLTADVAIGRKKFDEAIQSLSLYTLVVPDARALSKMAYAHMSLSPPDTAGARMAAERALLVNPDDSQAHIALARVNLIQKQNDAALAHYEAAEGFAIPARDAFLMGRIYESKKDLPNAGVAFRTAVSIDSTNKEYLNFLGSNAMNLQQYEDAADAYARLLVVDPGNVSAGANRAAALIQLDKLDEAETMLKSLIKSNESSPEFQLAMGNLYLKKADRPNAKAAFQQVLSLSPKGPIGTQAGENLGYMLWEDGDFAAAVPVLKQALGYNECNIRAMLTLANCYVKLNQTPEAITLLNQGDSCPGSDQVRQMRKALGG
ncbi:MAG: tetratricopeptide repeat protein [Candidatus Eisenbacteria bacterium]|nr:tetratricopeptide repeat protein [Candidatus Eisenbacteria bacterium]